MIRRLMESSTGKHSMTEYSLVQKTIYNQLRNDLALCFGSNTSLSLHRRLPERLNFILDIAKLKNGISDSIFDSITELTNKSTDYLMEGKRLERDLNRLLTKLQHKCHPRGNAVKPTTMRELILQNITNSDGDTTDSDWNPNISSSDEDEVTPDEISQAKQELLELLSHPITIENEDGNDDAETIHTESEYLSDLDSITSGSSSDSDIDGEYSGDEEEGDEDEEGSDEDVEGSDEDVEDSDEDVENSDEDEEDSDEDEEDGDEDEEDGDEEDGDEDEDDDDGDEDEDDGDEDEDDGDEDEDDGDEDEDEDEDDGDEDEDGDGDGDGDGKHEPVIVHMESTNTNNNSNLENGKTNTET
jgi:hypothetical protein